MEPTDPKILKRRQQWREANDRRRNGTQLPMADYRAKIAAEAAERRERRKADREAARVRKRAEQAAERAARQSARKERQRELQRKWREANRDRSRALQKAWREKNREKRRSDKRARKAGKRASLISELRTLQRGRCAYCREGLGKVVHVDHVMPLKLGGADDRSNLQLTCERCNLTKNAQHPVDFAQSLGRLI